MQLRNRQLTELIPEWATPACTGIAVSGLCQDSRQVLPGMLFCARSGLQHKGVDFVPAAVAAGACAVLVDASELPSCPRVDVPVIAIPNLVGQLGLVAARYYADPSHQMVLIGITGTNGKTSCAHFLAQALNQLGRKTALIGTVGNGFPGQLDLATHTTPDAISLQKLLAEFKADAAEIVVMEVSSHALEQMRVAGVAFDYGLFTNLTRDHLDYHDTMEAYGAAKARLFTDYPLKMAVINRDDAFGESLLLRADLAGEACCVGRSQGDVHLKAYRLTQQGLEGEFNTRLGAIPFKSGLLGEFNLDNLLLVAAVLEAEGYSAEQISSAVSGLQAVPGRMQALLAGQGPVVIIDYAHTPDALEKALQGARAHCSGVLWCVFGCGGDRDQGKRPLMGAVADRLADEVIITSDNPRHEDADSIIIMVASGVKQHTPYIEADRATAITRAVQQAGKADLVLVAGKGHEDYQEIAGQRYSFSDYDVCQQALEARI
ncbi:UDP-N-acetylmuramoyl-L-alanyl-D-glutamate--2,6-diaminopimelate ligase [Pontibacter sp. JAM-7]|uniref:UDP-N-acetylmuramoyl-L-alanyl-D-glutamate--2, 6-diaminopimelate ligase n=1 Tax=Pontibacter sp. JAM-7 TaxID=3366581 RepID=UPI003AF70653